MQDTKNLKRKVEKTYPDLIKEAIRKGDDYTAKFWTDQLERTKQKIALRDKNRKKNEKQRKRL